MYPTIVITLIYSQRSMGNSHDSDISSTNTPPVISLEQDVSRAKPRREDGLPMAPSIEESGQRMTIVSFFIYMWLAEFYANVS